MALTREREAARDATSPSTVRGRKATPAISIAAALLVVYVLWGSTYFGIRVGLDSLPPFLMAGVRFVVAGLLLIGWAWWRYPALRRMPTSAELVGAAVVGLALLGMGNGGVSWAEQYVPTSTAALIISTTPIWMVVLGRIFWREPVHPVGALGIAVGFVGMALLVWPANGFAFDPRGTAILFLASISWATGSLLARAVATPPAPGLGAGLQMLAGGLALLLVSIVSGDAARLHPSHVSVPSLLALAYLILFGSVVAFSCYAWLLHHARLSLVSTYAYVNPVVAVALGTLFLGERLSSRTLAAAAVIIAAVAVIVATPRPRPVR